MDAFKTWLRRRFTMRVYGESMLKVRVLTEITRFQVVLALQFGVDLWAWSRAAHYALSETSSQMVPFLAGLVFATAILMLDIAIVTMDQLPVSNGSGSWIVRAWKRTHFLRQLVYRLCLLVFVSLITAVPVELAICQPEIEKAIDGNETDAIDVIREEALRQERAKGEAEIERVRATSQADVDKITNDRKVSRDTLVQTQNAQRQSFQDGLDHALAREANEVNGVKENGRTGARGVGPEARRMREMADDAQQRLNEFGASTLPVLQQFDIETERLRTEASARRDASMKDATNARDAKIEEIKLYERDKLAALYGGNWKEPRGFLRRFQILEDLQEKSSYVRTLILGSRLTMIVLGLLILILKFTASSEFKEYYSVARQARAGNPDAETSVRAGGHDPKTYGIDPAIRAELLKWAQICTEWDIAYYTLLMKIGQLATRNFDGAYSTRDEVASAVYREWITPTFQDAVRKVAMGSQYLKAKGIEPVWPEELANTIDPRLIAKPWDMSAEDLQKYFGWRDPGTYAPNPPTIDPTTPPPTATAIN